MGLDTQKVDKRFEHGLSVTYRKYSHYPIASVVINVMGAGSHSEPVYQLSHLVEHLVYMNMKSQAALIPDIYISAQTNLDSAQYSCRLPAAHAAEFCHWFQSACQDPAAFTEQLMAREKKAIRNELNKPANSCHDMLPDLGWAQGTEQDWSAFEALDTATVQAACESGYISSQLHIEVAGDFSATQLTELYQVLETLDVALKGEPAVAPVRRETVQQPKLILNKERNLVGYFCEVTTASRNSYLAMACAHQLFHATTPLSLYHNLRFEKGYIYNLIRAYHLFQGVGQYALFAQVQPEQAERVLEEVEAFFSGSGDALLDGFLPWAAKKSLSSQMLAMEPLSEITKRASQHYINFHLSMDEKQFYQYLSDENLEAVYQDIRRNYFNQNIEVVKL
ncbi:insulinase family protein [Pseudoalteromonas rubra]|uniref:insulinase family protein n=1 Tax=Pseudoalteromonas rubra TaxID=43658 RepID=UPI000F79F2C0|nr:insulinase family protein [Pseudoalteromonas rubra]